MSNTNIKTIQLTAEGLEELKKELQDLTDNRLPQIISRVAKARDQGDLSENSEYQNARDEQAIMEARIEEIKVILAKAKVVKQKKSIHSIGIGSTVMVVLNNQSKKTIVYHIVGEFESDPETGKISSVSPLGKALIGKKKGDQVEVMAPAGKMTYLIKEIK